MHSDQRGIPLAVGDTVVWSSMERAGVTIGTVIEFTPKKIRVRGLTQHPDYSRLKEPMYLLKVELPDA